MHCIVIVVIQYFSFSGRPSSKWWTTLFQNIYLVTFKAFTRYFMVIYKVYVSPEFTVKTINDLAWSQWMPVSTVVLIIFLMPPWRSDKLLNDSKLFFSMFYLYKWKSKYNNRMKKTFPLYWRLVLNETELYTNSSFGHR